LSRKSNKQICYNFFLRLGTFGAMIEYGVERRVSTHSTLGATMVVGIPVGVTLRVKLVRASQTYIFPIHLVFSLAYEFTYIVVKNIP
jgi:hypothetical protein